MSTFFFHSFFRFLGLLLLISCGSVMFVYILASEWYGFSSGLVCIIMQALFKRHNLFK